MRKTVAILLMFVLALSLCGCGKVSGGGKTSGNDNLMEDREVNITIDPKDVEKDLQGEGGDYLRNFAASLIKTCNSEENTLVSPLSVIYALAMTSNGADGQTRTELLEALSEGAYTGEVKCGTSSTGVGDIWDEKQGNLNDYLRAYLNRMENREEWWDAEEGLAGELHIANSIWFKDAESLKVEDEFLKLNSKYYNAGIYKAEFNEESRKRINKWIEDYTEGMIKDMLKELPDEAVMYLINALSFQGNWASPFDDYMVRQEIFHGESADKNDVSFMYGSENSYLEDEKAEGFIKPYKGWRYGFVGLLPKEGVSLDEYIKELDGEGLSRILSSSKGKEVIYSIPKFKEESALSLVDAFKAMGVETPFDMDKADFKKMATSANGNICIGNILHNTYIEVDEKGTKAGAATIVEMVEESALLEEEPPKEVYLNRPFVYMIVDLDLNIPVFIGTVKNL